MRRFGFGCSNHPLPTNVCIMKRNFEKDYVKAIKKVMREEVGMTPTRITKNKKNILVRITKLKLINCLLSSVGQSTWFVISGSPVRLWQKALNCPGTQIGKAATLRMWWSCLSVRLRPRAHVIKIRNSKTKFISN